MLNNLGHGWTQVNYLNAIVLRDRIISTFVDELDETAQFAFGVEAWPNHHVLDARYASRIVHLWQVFDTRVASRNDDDFTLIDCHTGKATVLGQAYFHRLNHIVWRRVLVTTLGMTPVHLTTTRIHEEKGTTLEAEKLGKLVFKLSGQREVLFMSHEHTESVKNLVRSALRQVSPTFTDKALKDRRHNACNNFEGFLISPSLKLELRSLSVF